MCVNPRGRQHCICTCVHTHAERLRSVAGRAGGYPLAARGLLAGPPPSSTLPAQAVSSRPAAASVQLSLILSLESQIPAVVWENKCAERAEYLMGPFSDRNDSGNEPPLSYGCQGLLLGWLCCAPRSSAASRSSLRAGEGDAMPRAVQDAGEGGRGGSVGLEMADAACPVSLHAHRYNACSLCREMLSLGKRCFGELPRAGAGVGHCSGVGRSRGQWRGQPHSSRGFAGLCACSVPPA